MAYASSLTDTQLRAAAVPVSGTITANVGTGTQPVSGTFWQATQPVSGTVIANAGTGTFAVSGPLTDAQLRAAVVPVSLTSTTITGSVAVTGTFWQATQPVSGTVTANAGTGTFAVSAASLPLPAGASTETTLAAINTKTPALGQALMAASSPVVLASNQSALAVTGTFWQATQPVSGTVTANAGTGTFAISAASLPLPAGAATDGVLTGGTQKSIARGGAKGTTSAADVTSFATDANTQALHTNITNFPATQAVSLTSTTITGSVAVTGTFWQATQPISIAAALPTGANVIGALTANQSVNKAQINGVTPLMGNGATGTGSQRVTIASDNTPFSVISAAADAAATFRGRTASFRTPGRAGTTGQRIFALHNATGSSVVVRINQLTVDLAQSVVKAVTVLPPIIRVHRVTVLPTNGTALTKVQKDTAQTSNASVTVFGDASADGTSSATALTATIPANSILTQEFAPRLITAAGYEMADRMDFLAGNNIVLRALEGIVVNLDYVLATQNPTTDMWTVTCDWWEAVT